MALGDKFRLPIAIVLYYYMPYSTMTIGLKVRPCEIQLAVMALSVKVEKLAVSCIFVWEVNLLCTRSVRCPVPDPPVVSLPPLSADSTRLKV